MSRSYLYPTVLLAIVLLLAATALTALDGRIGLALIGLATLAALVCVIALESRRNTRSVERYAQQLERRARDLEDSSRRMETSLAILVDASRTAPSQQDLGKVRRSVKAVDRQLEDLGQRAAESAELLGVAAASRKGFEKYVRNQMRSLPRSLVQQVQAQLQLQDRFDPRAPLVAAGGWALAPTVTIEVVDQIVRHRPELVVECGSGLSTVWLGYAIREAGSGRVVALEHDEHYLAQTRRMIEAHGLDDFVEVRHAPLHEILVGDAECTWYSTTVDDLRHIGVLLVDGPPSTTGEHARYPAVPLLRAHMVPGAVIILDDASRPDEQAVIRRWIEEDDTIAVDSELPGGAVVLHAR